MKFIRLRLLRHEWIQLSYLLLVGERMQLLDLLLASLHLND